MTNEQLQNIKNQLRDRLREIQMRAAELRADLIETAGVQPTILHDPIDHAKETSDLNNRIEIHRHFHGQAEKLIWR